MLDLSPLREPFSTCQTGLSALRAKFKIANSRLFTAFHKHLFGPHVLACPVPLYRSSSRYPVATASASIRRTMLPTSRRRVRWLSASRSQ